MNHQSHQSNNHANQHFQNQGEPFAGLPLGFVYPWAFFPLGLDLDFNKGKVRRAGKQGFKSARPLLAWADHGTQDRPLRPASIPGGPTLVSRNPIMGAHGMKPCLTEIADPRPIDYICDMAKVKNIDTLSLDSSILCCNFVNTLSSWKEQGTHDYLDSYGTFLKWCRKTGAGSPGLLQKLEESEQKGEQRQIKALKEIKDCRNLLQNFLSAIANGNRPGQSALLPKIDLLLREAGSREYLEYGNGRFNLGHEEDPDELLAPLWSIIGSLKGLLIDNDAARIKECPSCGWIFLDETKNGGRIWCNPKICGTRDKMKRYNERKKESRIKK